MKRDKKVNILIADSDKYYRESLKEYLEYKNFNVVTTGCGSKAISMLKREPWDILLADIILKKIDGFEILEEIKTSGLPVRTIIISDFIKGAIVREALKKGAWYFLSKDTDFDIIKKRIELISGIDPGEEKTPYPADRFLRNRYFTSDTISRDMADLGFSMGSEGFRYLKNCVLLCTENMNYMRNITGLLYPKTGEKYGVTPAAVESAIRTLIKKTFSESSKLKDFLERSGTDRDKKPTNSSMIRLIMNYREIKTGHD